MEPSRPDDPGPAPASHRARRGPSRRAFVGGAAAAPASRRPSVRAQEPGWHPEHRDTLAMNGDQRLRDLAATGA
ncbi:hypothetical protein ABZX69_41455 [Streptomyces sp. NPDC004074]|uniref:hypothetical protein n=1 Tax=Streptomyces sp. NPDC004074 TaxID=3154277 RepID=UPI00339FCF1A